MISRDSTTKTYNTFLLLDIFLQVPSWFDKTPAWFDETPWWFKAPPPWFQNPPDWFNSPTKSHVEIEPGFEIERPDQIIKNVGTSNETSSTYYDEKTLRWDCKIFAQFLHIFNTLSLILNLINLSLTQSAFVLSRIEVIHEQYLSLPSPETYSLYILT